MPLWQIRISIVPRSKADTVVVMVTKSGGLLPPNTAWTCQPESFEHYECRGGIDRPGYLLQKGVKKKMEQMRDFTFALKSGFSPVSKRSARMKGSVLPFTTYCRLRVNLPADKQMSACYPILIKRLESDWGKSLSSQKCSTGDFGLALHEGRVSLGHVVAEIYCLCWEYVTDCLGYGHVDYNERFFMTTDSWSPETTSYLIRLFFSEKLPPQFTGLEVMVVGYLNACFENKPFDIHQKLNKFVEYRSHPRRRKNILQWLANRLSLSTCWLFI